MTRPSRILSLLILLALPLGLMADGHIKTVKKIIIDGEEAAAGDLEMIEEIIEKIDGDKRTRIVIARDHEGDVEVEAHEGHHMALAPRRGHHGGKGHHGPMGRHHKGMGALSEDAADCVLKNIRNAQSDAAAKAVVHACRTLNPMPE